MKLSRKGIYALRVLRQLAAAYDVGPLSVSALAEADELSVKYLEQVIGALRKRGIVVSTRGKEGGYRLRLPPDQITLGDAIRAVDGPLAPLACASRTAPHFDAYCPDPPDNCWLRTVMLNVRDAISQVLDKQTLADLDKMDCAGGKKA